MCSLDDAWGGTAWKQDPPMVVPATSEGRYLPNLMMRSKFEGGQGPIRRATTPTSTSSPSQPPIHNIVGAESTKRSATASFSPTVRPPTESFDYMMYVYDSKWREWERKLEKQMSKLKEQKMKTLQKQEYLDHLIFREQQRQQTETYTQPQTKQQYRLSTNDNATISSTLCTNCCSGQPWYSDWMFWLILIFMVVIVVVLIFAVKR